MCMSGKPTKIAWDRRSGKPHSREPISVNSSIRLDSAAITRFDHRGPLERRGVAPLTARERLLGGRDRRIGVAGVALGRRGRQAGHPALPHVHRWRMGGHPRSGTR
jgi:hypothetical protein